MLFRKCNECGQVIETIKLERKYYVCDSCDYYWSLGYEQRLKLIVDENSFIESNVSSDFYNPIDFPGYYEKHINIMSNKGLQEAIVTGEATICGHPVMIGIMDTRYMMGSMGVIVGEKIARLFEDATNKEYPVIIFTASGGARMQEGIFSLMQMGKTAGAVMGFSEAGGLYISVLTNPTTGGVSASFAFLGDIILAEPGAIIGFAGKRVIEQTIKTKLPKNFQTSEFLFDHGYIDKIVKRIELRDTLGKILLVHESKK